VNLKLMERISFLEPGLSNLKTSLPGTALLRTVATVLFPHPKMRTVPKRQRT